MHHPFQIPSVNQVLEKQEEYSGDGYLDDITIYRIPDRPHTTYNAEMSQLQKKQI
jgi:hypothetical protein